MADLIIYDKPYEKQTGTACPAPYVDVTISALTGRRSVDVSFRARIDTGADITCIPGNQAKMLMPLLLGKPVLIRAHDGSVKRARTHLMIISIHDLDGYCQEWERSIRIILRESRSKGD